MSQVSWMKNMLTASFSQLGQEAVSSQIGPSVHCGLTAANPWRGTDCARSSALLARSSAALLFHAVDEDSL